MQNITISLLGTFSAAFVCCLALVATQRWHGQYSFDTLIGAQKFHHDPTPRVGGIAIVSGLLVAAVIGASSGGVFLWPLLLAGVPAFAAGLAEDLSKQIGVKLRLLATMASGAIACLITGITVSSVDVPGADWLLSHTWLAIAFTAFAVAGIANAINIIDGFNGLAGGVAIIIVLAFAGLSASYGDTALAGACLMMAACILGFLLVNFPFGRIFLGDGGAYVTGFALAWLSVLIMHRNPDVSAWTIVLICAYPVVETLFSMWRKHHREGHHPSEPDGLHLHMLLHKRVIKKLMPGKSKTMQNSMTAPLAWALATVPAAVAVFLPSEPVYSIVALACFTAMYIAVYSRLTQFSWVRKLRADS